MGSLIPLSILLLSSLATTAQSKDPNALAGRWLNEKKIAIIEISRDDDGAFSGRIVWMKEPEYPADDPKGMAGRPRIDRENPDPALRDRPLLGLVIMRRFVFDGEDSWSGGRLYDPENGKEYRGRMKLTAPDTLLLRGYVGITLFGRSETWSRVEPEV